MFKPTRSRAAERAALTAGFQPPAGVVKQEKPGPCGAGAVRPGPACPQLKDAGTAAPPGGAAAIQECNRGGYVQRAVDAAEAVALGELKLAKEKERARRGSAKPLLRAIMAAVANRLRSARARSPPAARARAPACRPCIAGRGCLVQGPRHHAGLVGKRVIVGICEDGPEVTGGGEIVEVPNAKWCYVKVRCLAQRPGALQQAEASATRADYCVPQKRSYQGHGERANLLGLRALQGDVGRSCEGRSSGAPAPAPAPPPDYQDQGAYQPCGPQRRTRAISGRRRPTTSSRGGALMS